MNYKDHDIKLGIQKIFTIASTGITIYEAMIGANAIGTALAGSAAVTCLMGVMDELSKKKANPSRPADVQSTSACQYKAEPNS